MSIRAGAFAFSIKKEKKGIKRPCLIWQMPAQLFIVLQKPPCHGKMNYRKGFELKRRNKMCRPDGRLVLKIKVRMITYL